MPNHVKNRITGPAEPVQRLIGQSDEGKAIVDFNRIIPMPEAISTDGVGCHIEQAAQIALGLINWRGQQSPVDSFRTGNYGAAAAALHLSNVSRQLVEGPFPKDFSDKDFELFNSYLNAYRQCDGLMNWYDWSIAKWGTKWNAYDFEQVSETEIKFETAWSAPHPVMEELHGSTGIAFKHEWADEDTGRNVGVRHYAEGSYTESILDKSKQGYELAFALGHADPASYELVGDEYQYREEVDA